MRDKMITLGEASLLQRWNDQQAEPKGSHMQMPAVTNKSLAAAFCLCTVPHKAENRSSKMVRITVQPLRLQCHQAPRLLAAHSLH